MARSCRVGAGRSICVTAGTFSYNFDADGRLSNLVNPAGESYSWTYLDKGWLSTQSSSSVLTTAYSYNAAGQLIDLANRKPGSGSTLLSEWSGMRYDGAGDLISIQANVPAVTAYSGLTTYGFSGLDQLLSE